MATTTATVNITSSDLTPGSSLSVNASSTLMETGLTTGLEIMDMGAGTILLGDDDNTDALHEASAVSGDQDTTNYVYLCNKSTDDTYYIEYKIHETVIGRLYAGDWMFVPYNASDGDAEIEVKALTGINKIEYAMFKTAWTLPAAES